MKGIYCILILIFTCGKQKYFQHDFNFLTIMTDSTDKNYSFLCLGDSYTIGEGVFFLENFPNQMVQLARKSGYKFLAPEIVAKTGWTTYELQAALKNNQLLSSYDFVTLLIGVNNQYRNHSINEYEPEFELLLQDAITYAGGNTNHVIVLSIPDWGVTPFAIERDSEKIALEIDSYNKANMAISEKNKVHYIDITESTRESVNNPFLLAPDGLHPSAKEYARWAEKVFSVIKIDLSKKI